MRTIDVRTVDTETLVDVTGIVIDESLSKEERKAEYLPEAGGSGSGKTMSVAEPRFLETKYSNLIATVAKRRLVGKYVPLFRKRKYKVLDLNLANPRESTCAYDPMKYIESNSDITFLAKSIVKADPQKEKSMADPETQRR